MCNRRIVIFIMDKLKNVAPTIVKMPVWYTILANLLSDLFFRDEFCIFVAAVSAAFL